MIYLYTILIGWAINIIGLAARNDTVALVGALVGGAATIAMCAFGLPKEGDKQCETG